MSALKDTISCCPSTLIHLSLLNKVKRHTPQQLPYKVNYVIYKILSQHVSKWLITYFVNLSISSITNNFNQLEYPAGVLLCNTFTFLQINTTNRVSYKRHIWPFGVGLLTGKVSMYTVNTKYQFRFIRAAIAGNSTVIIL